MKIKLHLGAHKTASTHIQHMLKASQKHLHSKDVFLSTPNELRQQWLPSFIKYLENRNEDLLKDIIVNRSFTNWIISEENLSGSSYDLKTKAGIYPDIRKRLEAFKEIFCGYNIEIFFSIRCYHDFYRSAYLEVVRNRGYLPFEEFYNEDRFKNNSWIDVVDTFVEIFGEDSITLWRYDDLQELTPIILEKITGRENVKTIISSYTPKITRPSLSEKGLSILKYLYSKGNLELGNKLTETIIKKYPEGKIFQAFIPFEASQIKQFQKKYQSDIQCIQKRYPKIDFLCGKKL